MGTDRLTRLCDEWSTKLHTDRLQDLASIKLADLLSDSKLRFACICASECATHLVATLLKQRLCAQDESAFRCLIGQLETEGQAEAELVAELVLLLREQIEARHIEYLMEEARALNRLSLEFLNDFSMPDGSIDWEKLVRFNSGKAQ